MKTHAEVVVAVLSDGSVAGKGECVPYARYGETVQSVVETLSRAASSLAEGRPVSEVIATLPPGAARNALDCASWDLTARRGEGSVASRLGRIAPPRVETAVTLSLDTPAAMAGAARAVAEAPLLKVKLSAENPAAALLAVTRAAPNARLIVDPNEGWTLPILLAMADPISRANVILVEQPLPADFDSDLKGLSYPVPICADEAVHTSTDLEQVAERYQMVNVKLDKAGGLTEALMMTERAKAFGLGVLAGCMVSSSLSIAPMLWIAGLADACDLDGPWWLSEDRASGCRVEHGVLYAPQPGFWG